MAALRSAITLSPTLRPSTFAAPTRRFIGVVPVAQVFGGRDREYFGIGSGLRRFSSSEILGRRLSVGARVEIKRKGVRMGSSVSSAAVTEKTVHDFVVKGIDGNDVELSSFKGKVLLIVNVASQCGLTNSNYKELTQLYSKYKDQGFEILAFPSNQFGQQEPGTNEQIKEFACSRFKAEYPLFDKVDVNGPNAAPLYAFLKASKGGGLLGDSIKWNFAKFLVDQNGTVVDRYAPTTSPSKIEGDIKKLLK